MLKKYLAIEQESTLNRHIPTLLTSSRNSLNYTGKTVSNNLNHEVRNLINSVYESQSSNTNEIIDNDQIKKSNQ